jgi:cytochrome c-type biogenesis protein CcmH
MGDAQIVELVENLARKVRERPEDAQGWALLARSMAAIGRFPRPRSLRASRQARRATPDVLADWADALGMAQGRTLKGRPQELAQAALEVDPKHPQGARAGGDGGARDRATMRGAIGYWQRLRGGLEPRLARCRAGGPILAEVRGRAAAAAARAAVRRRRSAAPHVPREGAAPGSSSPARSRSRLRRRAA